MHQNPQPVMKGHRWSLYKKQSKATLDLLQRAMYFISSWICTKSSKNLFVKIVHPGGHVEIHDRPILAADLLSRHPKCCVAHPDVFHHPYAVVSPSATLSLGHKYYVVPIRTIKRLQLKYSCSQTNAHEQKSRRERGGERPVGIKSGRMRLSVAHFDQWQPGLESIKEE